MTSSNLLSSRAGALPRALILLAAATCLSSACHSQAVRKPVALATVLEDVTLGKTTLSTTVEDMGPGLIFDSNQDSETLDAHSSLVVRYNRNIPELGTKSFQVDILFDPQIYLARIVLVEVGPGFELTDLITLAGPRYQKIHCRAHTTLEEVESEMEEYNPSAGEQPINTALQLIIYPSKGIVADVIDNHVRTIRFCREVSRDRGCDQCSRRPPPG